jgi:cytochrome P450
MVWILKFLSENPEIQGKLRDELQSELPAARQGIRMPTAEEIINSDLPYLDAIIEETLRLRAAMLVPRDAIRDTQLLGCRIPKGTVILLVCQGPEMAVEPASPFFREQKRLRKFPGDGNPDLEVFDPERWLIRHKNGKVEFDGSSYPQLAFGVGVRACWGRKLALLEMKIMTAMATLKFDMLELPPSLSSHEGIYDISFKPLQGYVRLRCR